MQPSWLTVPQVPNNPLRTMPGCTDAVSHVSWGQDARIIGLVGLAHAASHFGQLVMPVMFPVLMAEFGLSYAQLGGLMTTLFVVSAILQAGAGFVVDRLGARLMLFGAIGLYGLACVWASLVTGYAGLLGVAVLSGVANAAFHPVDFTLLNHRVSPERLGYAFSAHGLSGSLGLACAPVFMATLYAVCGWRMAYLAAASLYVGILALMVWQRDKLSTPGVSHQRQSANVLAFLRWPVVWWCFGFFVFSTMTLAVIQGFSVSILQAMYGISFKSATWTLTAYMLSGALGMLTGGWLAVRSVHSNHVVAMSMTCAALLLALCGTGALGGTVTMGILAATGFAVGLAGPSRDMMIKQAASSNGMGGAGSMGRVYGLVYSGLDIGSAISPMWFGVWLDHGWYRATLLGAACFLILSVGAALEVGRSTARSEI